MVLYGKPTSLKTHWIFVNRDASGTMKFTDYRQAVQQLGYGKRLPGAVYVYRDENADFGKELSTLLAQVVSVYQIGSEFNLIKFRTDEFKISFLSYPDFFDEPHPALRKAMTIDLATGKVRHTDYANNINPPILHRKETFLRPNHSEWSKFRALTDARTIGRVTGRHRNHRFQAELGTTVAGKEHHSAWTYARKAVGVCRKALWVRAVR